MKKVLSHLFAATLLVLPLITFADIGLQNPIKVNSISELILIVTRVARYIAIPFVVIAIMYSGWLFLYAAYITPAKASVDITKAKSALYSVVIGSFILLSAELIALVMRNTIDSLTK